MRAVLLALTLGACASGPESRPAVPPPRSSEPESTAVELQASSLQREPPLGARLAVRLPDGRIGVRRAELVRVQKEGPHWLLQRIKVRPLLRKGRFVGWRVVSYAGPGKLLAGDVVRQVNGRPIERPEQFIEVWNKMVSRDTLEVDLVRAGKSERLTFPIVRNQATRLRSR